MVDARAHPGASGVAAGEVGRHFFAARLFPLELRLQPAALEQGQIRRRAVGGVSPHIAGRVAASSTAPSWPPSCAAAWVTV
jgi:hypothetical protein